MENRFLPSFALDNTNKQEYDETRIAVESVNNQDENLDNKESSKRPDESDSSEKQTETAPNNEKSEKDKQDSNSRENGEVDFEKEHEELKEKLLNHEISCETVEAISSLQVQGGEELIDIYGVSRFVDALKEANAREKNGLIERNMYEVVKILEPDQKRRREVFDKIYKKIEEETEAENKKDYYESIEYDDVPHGLVYAPRGNDIMRKNMEVNALKNVDIYGINLLNEAFNKFSKNPSSLYSMHSYKTSSFAGKYKSFFYYPPEEINLDEFKTDLEDSDNKEGEIFGATLKKIERINKGKEELTKEMNKFVKEINDKILYISEKIDQKFLKNIKEIEVKYPVLNDELKDEIKNKSEEKFNSESGQKSHVEEVAGKMFEKEFLKLAEKHEEDIQEQTRKYEYMLMDMKFSWQSEALSKIVSRD